MKRVTSIAAAMITAAFLTGPASASAQDSNVNQRTFLTFSGPVQMPGVTLPAGKYVFRLADTSLHNVMQVFDADEKNIIGQWFFVSANRTTEEASAADGKPVVSFRETPEGMAPAVRYYFYPTDLTGKEFIYPKEQAVKIAAATHEAVLATDSDASKGGSAHIFRVDPNGTESAVDGGATASSGDQNQQPAASAAAATPTDDNRASAQPAATSGSSVPEPATESATAQSSPAQSSPAQSSAAQSSPAQSAPQSGAAQSGARAANQSPAPRQQAAAELPRTASPFQLVGLIGLMALAGGFGLRLARARATN